MTRPTTDEIRRHLKLATKSALYAAGGAAGIVAQKMTRVGEAALSFYASLSDDHCHRLVPLDVALDLDFVAGEPIHARALASAQGYRLVSVVEEKPNGRFALSDLARISHDFSEVQACCFDALEDGAISEAERIAILDKISELERGMAQMRAKLHVGV